MPERCVSNGVGGIGSYVCDFKTHTHTTGFCENGWHEGSKATLASGRGVKTCPMISWCKCSCHATISSMFGSEGTRAEMENPLYIPYARDFWMPTVEELVTVRVAAQTVQFDGPEPPVFKETPSGRSGRGQLEYETKVAVEEWMSEDDDLEECTISWIAERILRNRDDPNGKIPSVGAVHAVLMRWHDYGYCYVAKGPVRFDGLTPEGMRDGLDKMRAAHKLKAGK